MMRQLIITPSITTRDSESIKKYLREIDKYPILSLDEEVELAQRIHEGDMEARNRLVQCNLRFVVSVAKQMAQSNQVLGLMDLINEGNMGLVKAAERYDETRGFKFITYSVWWIRQSILQAICDQGAMIRVPQNNLGDQHRIFQFIAEYEQQNEHRPSVQEISDSLDMEEDRVAKLLGLNNRHTSIDNPLKEGEDGTLIDILPNENATAADKDMDMESMRSELSRALSALSKRERTILQYFYGLGCLPCSLDEVSERMNLSRERVRQIRDNATRALRHVANASILRTYI